MFRKVFSIFSLPQRGDGFSHQINVENPDINPETQTASVISEQEALQIRIDQLKQFKAEIEEMESQYKKPFFRWQASTVLGSVTLTAALGAVIGRLNHKFFNPYWEQKDLLYKQRFVFMQHRGEECRPVSFGCMDYYPNFLHFGSDPMAYCNQSGYSPLENIVCPDLYIQVCLNIMDTMCNILNSTDFQYMDDDANRHNLETTLNQLIGACCLTPLFGLMMLGLIDWFKNKMRMDLIPVSALQKEKLQEYISQTGSNIHLNISKKGLDKECINSTELYSQIDKEIAWAKAKLVVINIDRQKNNRPSFFQPDGNEQRAESVVPDESVYLDLQLQ
ncbi:hypothetical protein Lbir_1574 [Legionella birminghamensis]|uniref:Uncharacterized protein n=1 Tax=Legionella birminghamensis TaxID=28083 RepID=A0A378IJW7_9GAMM|nr:hypothetical protein [Legionella birminghamensis]KTC71719.1 hypothetical protein Lbir_1574 [Legionella birminghamensis]STX32444.1 Uncharacterised protein [Legionella birminghamensis]